jgi:hypothetical protein
MRLCRKRKRRRELGTDAERLNLKRSTQGDFGETLVLFLQ